MEKQTKIKNYLFGGIMLLLLLPMLQESLTIFKLEPLKGAIETVEKPEFSFETWKTGEFQKNYEKYVNANVGFRSTLIRINNQQAFSFYGEAKANGVIVGKENYLYEKNYLKAYLGTDFIGDKNIEKQTCKLRKIQDTLQKLHKDLLIVLAPGKGTFFPEYMPDYCAKQKRKKTNYSSYLRAMKAQQINFIDFNRWFLQMKPTSKYPLYGKAGIHWSKYGEYLAADSLINVIGKMRNLPMTQIILDQLEVKKVNEQGDYDIGEGMNLFFTMNTYPMAYPRFHFKKPTNFQKSPKVLVVSDSYYWGMFNFGMSREVFDNGQFWYYNQEIYPNSFESPITVSEIDIQSEVEKNELVVIICTDANLYKFGFGFIDQLYEKYYTRDK
jgi:hypothetical protein